MAYFGLQYRGVMPAAAATEALQDIAGRFAGEGGPSHWDRARYVDQAGYETVVTVAYWDDVVRFDTWFASAREVWTGQQREGIGTFIEVSWKGKPLANAEVEILAPDQAKPLKLSTDKQGSFVFEHAFRDNPNPGLYGIRVRHVEAKEGKFNHRRYWTYVEKASVIRTIERPWSLQSYLWRLAR